MLAMQPATAQSRSEKKAQTERSVREAINAGQYKIKVDYMQPMRGRSRALTSDYSIEIRNDSVFSYSKKERPGSTSRPAMKRISMSTA